MIKTLWRLSREAIRYRTLYVIAILSTLALTAVNLAAPRALGVETFSSSTTYGAPFMATMLLRAKSHALDMVLPFVGGEILFLLVYNKLPLCGNLV